MHRLTAVLATLGSATAALVPDFHVRTIRYDFAGVPAVAVFLSSSDVRAYDSLGLRIFVRSKDTVGTHVNASSTGLDTLPMTFSDAVAARYDICQRYDAAGFNRPCGDPAWGGAWSWGTLNRQVQLLQPVAAGAPDANGVRDWAFDLPLGPSALRSGEAIRFDFLLGARSEYAKTLSAGQKELLDSLVPFFPDRAFPAVGDTGWFDVVDGALNGFGLVPSWSFDGTPLGTSTDQDQLAAMGEDNFRLLVRRKGVDLWGFAPDGSGPGIRKPAAREDSSLLPYARIAAPTPVDGDRRPLDSALARPRRFRVNQAGYRVQDVAKGLARIRYYGAASSYTLVKEDGSSRAGSALDALGFEDGTSLVVLEQDYPSLASASNPMRKIDSDSLKTSIAKGPVQEAVLPKDLAPGRWRAVAGADTSSWFVVSDSVYGWVRDAALRYFGIQRSGDSSWFHGPSHMLDGQVAGTPGAYVGGWYDGGDHLKEPQTMAATLATLATMAATRPDRDADRWGRMHRAGEALDGIPDALKEARWGASFFLNSWIGHGRTTGPSGTDSGMVTGIGDFGKDHGWWGPADLQDQLAVAGRGGASERIVRRELGANTLGDVAAALAMLSTLWRAHDTAWANDALAAAKDMYAYAKEHRVVVSSPAYNGAGSDKVNANLALAATALLKATRDTSYLREIAYDKAIGSRASTVAPKANWEGGWMAMSNPNLLKGGVNTDWGNRHALALYAFARLILLDSDTAKACGVRDEAERQNLLYHVLSGMQTNLGSISGSGAKVVDFPSLDPAETLMPLLAGSDWGELFILQDWTAPGFMAGNAAELAMYADVAKELRDGKGGSSLGAMAWPVDSTTSLALRQLDWILGLNRWDISFLAGVGSKNLQNAHHRTANPDGTTTQIYYDYRTPVGALWGYEPTTTGKLSLAWNDYHHSEPILNGTTQLLVAAHLLAPEAATPAVGIGAARASVGFRLAARPFGRGLTARLEGAAPGSEVQLDLLDASGRRRAHLEAKCDARGALELSLPSAGGLSILRARVGGTMLTKTVATP